MFIAAFYGEVIQTYGSVGLMVNNAGIVHETEWRRCVDINLVSHNNSLLTFNFLYFSIKCLLCHLFY